MKGNITINSLLLQNLNSHLSPLFSATLLSISQNFNFQKFQLTKFSSPFFFYSPSIGAANQVYSNKLNFHLYSTCFKHFLSPVIRYSTATQLLHNEVSNHNGYASARSFTKGYIIIKHSSFISCKCASVNGSAIFTSVPLEIFNCEFNHCEGYFGACIFSTCPTLSIQFATFKKCTAQSQSAAFQMRQQSFTRSINPELENSLSKGININSSVISEMTASLFGSFYCSFIEYNIEIQKKFNHLNFILNNVTRSYAKSCVGIFEASHCFTNIKFSLMKFSGADIHNGGIVLRDTRSLHISTCNFLNLSHTSREKVSASVLLIYTTPQASVLENSYFIDNNNGKSSTITANNGDSLIVRNCFFSSDESSVFQCTPNEIQDNNEFLNKNQTNNLAKLRKMKKRDVFQLFFIDKEKDKTDATKKYQNFFIGYQMKREKGNLIQKNTTIFLSVILGSMLCTLIMSYLIVTTIIGILRSYGIKKFLAIQEQIRKNQSHSTKHV